MKPVHREKYYRMKEDKERQRIKAAEEHKNRLIKYKENKEKKSRRNKNG